MLLRWGIAGCGKISGDFVRALRLLPKEHHQVVAAAAGDEDRASAFLAKHGGSGTGYGSYAELFADPSVDVVYVGNLNHMHKETVVAGLKAGKHVLCEKPLAVNASEAAEMIATARTHRRFLMEGYWTRFFPVYDRIRRAIAEGAIGNIRAVLINFGYASHDPNKYRIDGGGCLMATGCYLPMITSMLFWPEKPERVHASGRLLPNGVDESGTITLYYEGGRMASLVWSGAANLPNSLTIAGDKGTINIPETWWSPTKVQIGEEEITERLSETNEGYEYPNGSGFTYEATAVHDAISKGLLEHPRMTLDESLFLAKLLDRIRSQIGLRFPQDTAADL